MRKRPQPSSRIPEVNLVPMMDVLMTVLIFFVVITMGANGIAINGVTLPQSVENANEVGGDAEEVPPLVIGLDEKSTLTVESEAIELDALPATVNQYFQANPEGSILLKADRALPYDNIADLLAKLREAGGRRVSLAVE